MKRFLLSLALLLTLAVPAFAQGQKTFSTPNPHTVFLVSDWHQGEATLIGGEVVLPIPGFTKGSSAREGCFCTTIGGGVSTKTHMKDYRYFTAGLIAGDRYGRFAVDTRVNVFPARSGDKAQAIVGGEIGLTLYHVRGSVAIQTGSNRVACGIGVRVAIF